MEEIAQQSFDEEESGLERMTGDAGVQEDMARRLLDCSKSGLAMLGRNGVVIECNATFASLLGSVRDDLVGDCVWARLSCKASALIQSEVTGVFESGKSCCFQDEHDGAWMECYIAPVATMGDRVMSVAIEISDITRRKVAEERLERRLVSLTKPTEDVGEVQFEDLVNLPEIQRLQDEFAAATGVASIITRTDGTPITEPSNFCRLCIDIIRKTEKGCANCFKSDAVLGRYHPEGPIVQPCMSGGLWDAGAAITVGGKHVANWLIGQVRDDTQTEDRMREYAREIKADEEIVVEAFNEVPAMSRERFGMVAQTLFTLANQLSTTAYQNVLQARFITDRERAERALRESEARNRTLVEHAPEAIIVLDTDAGVFVDMNGNAERLFGLPREELLKLGPADVSPAVQRDGRASAEAARIDVAKALAGQAQTFEWIHLNKSRGDEIPCEVRLVRLPSSGRNLVRGSVMDITDRKRAEEALRESESALAKSQEIAHVGSWKFDIKKNEWTWSDEVYRILGMERRESPESLESFFDVVHPEDRAMVDAEYRHSLETGIDNYEIEHRVIHKQTGEIRHVHEKCIIVRDMTGEVVRTFGIIQDITERKAYEEDLCRLRNYLSNIIDSMPSILIGVDPDGRVTQWNDEARKATGIPAEKAEGLLLSEAFPRMATKMEQVREAMETREVRYDAKQVQQMEGETRYEDVTVYPLFGHDVEGAVIRVDDVTERVRIEEMMVQAEKMLSVGGLAAGMAHEINNPLGGMMQAAQNIERRVSPSLAVNEQVAEKHGTSLEAIRSYLEEREVFRFLAGIRECGSRAAGIVTNMLQFSRKSSPRLALMNVAELIDRSVGLAEQDYDLKKKYDFRHIELVREYDPSTPSVHVVDTEIEQVVLNLLRNSAQAMQDNPPEKPPRLILRTMPDGAMARIEVEDNGPGIAEDVRTRVFEPFFTTKTVGEGTGLGLSVSYMIITQNHGGEMSVESTSGEGVKFIVKLPVGTAPSNCR